jgi:predicted Rossmann fold nucleotide-binding protein DprA/Smf involved in DNA uptake
MNWTGQKQERSIQDLLELSSIQKEILDQFKTKNAWTIDELAQSTNQPVSYISSALFELELKGALENKGANRYLLPL